MPYERRRRKVAIAGGVLIAALLASCGSPTADGKRQPTPPNGSASAVPTSTTPVVGTSFDETIADADGIELIFGSTSPVDAARSMASTMSAHNVRNGRVWLAQRGITVDVPNPTAFAYGSLKDELSAVAKSHGYPVLSYPFTEDDFSRGGRPLEPGVTGVEVVTAPVGPVNDGDLNATGIELVKALRPMRVTLHSDRTNHADVRRKYLACPRHGRRCPRQAATGRQSG